MTEKRSSLLTIVVISYNTQNLTIQTIESVITDLNRSPELQGETRLVVADNNSADETVAELKQIQPKNCSLEIIANQKNLGFAQANNLAIEKFPSKYYLLLNSDTIVKPGALSQLVRSMENNPINQTTAALDSHQGDLDKLGILAASLLNPDQTLQAQGGSFPNLTNLFIHMFFLDDLPLIGKFLPSTQHTGHRTNPQSYRQHRLKHKLIQTDWVGGTAVILRHQLVADIGLLDPNIFMYGEDVEYCLRAKNHHWDIAIDPKAEIVHLGSASSTPAKAILGEFKGYIYIWAKHKPDWQMPFLKSILWFGAVLRLVLFGTILKNKQKAQVYQRALNLISR